MKRLVVILLAFSISACTSIRRFDERQEWRQFKGHAIWMFEALPPGCFDELDVPPPIIIHDQNMVVRGSYDRRTRTCTYRDIDALQHEFLHYLIDLNRPSYKCLGEMAAVIWEAMEGQEERARRAEQRLRSETWRKHR